MSRVVMPTVLRALSRPLIARAAVPVFVTCAAVCQRRLLTSESAPKGIVYNAEPAAKDPSYTMLKATLPFVPSHGWSMESIALGAKSLGYPSVAHGVFPGGEAGLIDAFLKDCRREFVARIAELQASGKLEGLSMTEKVRELTAMRLMMMKPYIRRWPEALAVMGRPSNVSSSLLHLGEIADDVWYYAGDRSPDMRWYSKRASLSAIYSATEVYMTQDISPNYQETLRFLDRRLNDAAWLGACAGQLGTMLNFGARSFLGAIATRGGRFP